MGKAAIKILAFVAVLVVGTLLAIGSEESDNEDYYDLDRWDY